MKRLIIFTSLLFLISCSRGYYKSAEVVKEQAYIGMSIEQFSKLPYSNRTTSYPIKNDVTVYKVPNWSIWIQGKVTDAVYFYFDSDGKLFKITRED
jgi:hypothetical protein